ncbi:hypothetical protein [Enterococcus rivorum]|uniref:Uncharacterized protein n=1 Tax=Enterococcus rivorum TaxID=762845 RepID=A0A1E5KVJ9_9ENTE|nr:hypothetical protein [Enterococcus rivorum]MBP2098384.1 uncharacterized protein YbbC (DUF1343 family) [Enterococcus rivorum]OEH81830.1 hypothetical protein BCR26_03490 [Enterococcus rivorum]
MLSIISPMQQDAIKQLLQDYKEEDVQFTFKEKQGIKMLFEASVENEAVVKKVKELIKTQPWGSVLMVQVTIV